MDEQAEPGLAIGQATLEDLANGRRHQPATDAVAQLWVDFDGIDPGTDFQHHCGST
jgi:hypothetical protein